MDFNNLTNLVNEGIRNGIFSGKELIGIGSIGMISILSKKYQHNNKNRGECGLERKDCKSKYKLSCLKPKRKCWAEEEGEK